VASRGGPHPVDGCCTEVFVDMVANYVACSSKSYMLGRTIDHPADAYVPTTTLTRSTELHGQQRSGASTHEPSGHNLSRTFAVTGTSEAIPLQRLTTRHLTLVAASLTAEDRPRRRQQRCMITALKVIHLGAAAVKRRCIHVGM
jgi:hypothetical protein